MKSLPFFPPRRIAQRGANWPPLSPRHQQRYPAGMAIRKTAAKRTAATDKAAPSDNRRAAAKKTAVKAKKKPATKKTASKKSPAKTAVKKVAKKPAARTKRAKASASSRVEDAPRRPRPLSATDRERRFNLIVQTACLKAGTAAAISTITRKVPLLGKLAPVMMGSMAETVALSKIQKQLVLEILELYELELTDAEERGVILLATAANIGAQQLSKKTVEQLLKQFVGLLYRPVLARVLPIAAIVTEIAASVASTYAVGKRAQALCLLPGTGVRNLGELFRGLSGIDQTRLFKWSGEALSLALKPFRGALAALIPGFR
jgi:uncharacterized protein (DUF697 family)